MTYEEWPNCEVPDCPNKSCLRLDSPKCWPHTVGLPINWADGMKRRDRERKSDEITQNYLRTQPAKGRG